MFFKKLTFCCLLFVSTASVALAQSAVFDEETHEIKVKLGEKFSISRITNASVGTSCKIGFDHRMLNLDSQSSRYLGQRGMTGAGTENLWNFSAINTGKTTVTFVHSYRGTYDYSDSVAVEISD
ncbi:MAG: hypothetical protein HQK53_00655 [Oligoflexia bacterium]|nr:hypothetical protein [Oligoflexia bacterium]